MQFVMKIYICALSTRIFQSAHEQKEWIWLFGEQLRLRGEANWIELGTILMQDHTLWGLCALSFRRFYANFRRLILILGVFFFFWGEICFAANRYVFFACQLIDQCTCILDCLNSDCVWEAAQIEFDSNLSLNAILSLFSMGPHDNCSEYTCIQLAISYWHQTKTKNIKCYLLGRFPLSNKMYLIK